MAGNLTLRPYQTDAIGRLRQKIASGNKRLLMVLATGGGKTVVFAQITRLAMERGSRVLILAHRRELINQTVDKLIAVGINSDDIGVILSGDERDNPDAPIQVASVQTLARRTYDFDSDIIIVDECHHAVAKSYRDILEKHPEAIVIGVTATPYRRGGKGLGEVFDSIVEVADTATLIENGHLVSTRAFTGSSADLSNIRTRAGDYVEHELAEAVDAPELVGDIVLEWRRLAEKRLTLAFATSVEHSRHIADQFNSADIPAAHIDGTTPNDERAEILERLRRGELRIVVNCAVLTEGFDCPEVSCIILARPTKSRGLWRQIVGRGLRPHPGKRDCIILDHAGCTAEHGFVTDPDDVSLDDGIKKGEAPTFRCPHCSAEIRSWPARCPACGEALVREDKLKYVVRVNEHLVEATPERIRREFYARMNRYAFLNGYKPAFADVKFNERFGEWPTNADRRLAPYKSKWLGKRGNRKRIWSEASILS